jgi:hypothetical protein
VPAFSQGTNAFSAVYFQGSFLRGIAARAIVQAAIVQAGRSPTSTRRKRGETSQSRPPPATTITELP